MARCHELTGNNNNNNNNNNNYNNYNGENCTVEVRANNFW